MELKKMWPGDRYKKNTLDSDKKKRSKKLQNNEN